MERTIVGLLLVKAEVTYGTDAAPAGLNVLPIFHDSLKYAVSATAVERRPAAKKRQRVGGMNTMPNGTFTFSYELRGNYGMSPNDIRKGTSTQAIELDPILQAAHLIPAYTSETTGGANDGYVTYNPIEQTAELPSVTCYFYSQAKLHKLTGGKVDAEIVFEVGKPPMVNVTIKGKYVAVTDTGYSGVTPVYQVELQPPICQGISLTYGTNLVTPASNDATLICSKIAVQLGNSLVLRPSLVAADGVRGFAIADVKPSASFDPEATTEASHPFFADWVAGSVNALQFSVGSQAGNKMQMTLHGIPRDIPYGERAGIRTHDLKLDLVAGSMAEAEGAILTLKVF